MMRVLGILLFLLLIGLLLTHLADASGSLLLRWQDMELSATPLGTVLLILSIAILGWACIAAFRTIFVLPHRARQRARYRSHDRGLTALNSAFLALAKGDMELAGRHQRQAERQLPNHSLPLLLGAQIATQQRDDARQHQLMQQMLTLPESRALAARSLLAESLAKNDLTQAQNWATQALEADPKDAEIQRLRIHLLLRQRAFTQAHDQLQSWRGARQIRKADAIELDGLIATVEGQDAFDRRDYNTAIRLLTQAVKLRNGWLPALLPLAEAHHALQAHNEVKKLVEKGWKYAAHPRLAELHRLSQGNIAPHIYLKNVQSITRTNADAVESKLWLAYAAERGAEWALAREYAQAAVLAQPCREAHTMLAQLEQRLTPHLPAAAMEQRAKAASAPSLHWDCQRCSTPTDHWHPDCPACHSPESLEWNRPVQTALQFV